MEFQRAYLDTCSEATGIVVVIDVLRAFSTATYAFAAGAETITLVSIIAEALELRERNPQSLLMGEVEGLPIPGFDFGNSPPQFDGMDLPGRHLVQRTTSGTQGVVRSQKADILLAASFCNVGATARYISVLAPEKATYAITGLRPGGWGDEEAACADYLVELLENRNPSHAPYLQRVRESPLGRLFLDAEKIDFDYQDLEYCLAINRFNFAMPVSKQDGGLIIVAHPC